MIWAALIVTGASLVDSTRAACVGTKLFATGNSSPGFGTATVVGTDFAFFGAPGDSQHGSMSGAVYLFAQTSGTLTQQDKITASDASAGAQFGSSLALAMDRLVVGAPGESSVAAAAGAAYVFQRSGTSWEQQAKLVAPDGIAADQFGSAVAMGADFIAVAAFGQDAGANGAGAVYLLSRSGSIWTFAAKFTDPEPQVGGRFGHTVALLGDYVAIGSNVTDRVLVFRRNGAVWQLATMLTAVGAPPGETGFGSGLAMAGDFLVASALHVNGHEGAIYLFKLVGSAWQFQERKDAPDHFPLGHFGWSISMTPDRMAVGADFSRKMFLYQRIGDEWRYEAVVRSNNPSIDDGFGSVVAIGVQFAAAGTPLDEESGGAGAGYAFPLAQCVTAIPTLSGAGLAVMAVALVFFGGMLLRRKAANSTCP